MGGILLNLLQLVNVDGNVATVVLGRRDLGRWTWGPGLKRLRRGELICTNLSECRGFEGQQVEESAERDLFAGSVPVRRQLPSECGGFFLWRRLLFLREGRDRCGGSKREVLGATWPSFRVLQVLRWFWSLRLRKKIGSEGGYAKL